MKIYIQKTLMTTLLLFTSIVASSQLTESFDDVSSFQADGWIFDNRSDFPTKVFWSQGIESLFPAHSGDPTSYIFNTTASGGELVCNWLIMPDLGNIDQLSFYTRSQNSNNEVTRMLVMHSPTGSVNTGTCNNIPVKQKSTKGSNDFGDFQPLLNINQNQDVGAYPQDWTQYTVDVNGTGRIAFLYYVETGAPNFNAGTLAIDTINIGSGPIIAPQMVPSVSSLGVLSLISLLILIGILKSKELSTKENSL